MLRSARPAAGPTGFNNAQVNSSRLVRLLAGITAAPGAPAKLSFAERLGQWLGWADAISLCALLEGGVGVGDVGDAGDGAAMAPSGAAVGLGAAVGRVNSPAAALARLQTELARAIAGDAVFAAGAQPAEFQPYRRSHAAHQRAMAARVGALREQVRAALAQHSAGLHRLAALDLLMDGVVGAQERSSLSALSGWLEKRFEQLRDSHAGTLAESHAGADADSRTEIRTDWRADFGQEMQALLLAELDLRLQPVLGLIEALDPQKTA